MINVSRDQLLFSRFTVSAEFCCNGVKDSLIIIKVTFDTLNNLWLSHFN